MAQKNNNKSKRGFTIIEVVLVLAIAGLIFLMVFIALPALQRSQRDTQRRNDYSMLSTAVTSYITNNGGRVSKLTDSTSGVKTSKMKKDGEGKVVSGGELDSTKWINAEGTDPNGYPYNLYACKFSSWSAASSACGTGDDTVSSSGGKIPTTDSDNQGSEVFIITGANCDGSDSAGNSAPKADTGIRAYVIYGHLEGSGTYCQDNNRTGNDS